MEDFARPTQYRYNFVSYSYLVNLYFYIGLSVTFWTDLLCNENVVPLFCGSPSETGRGS